MTMLIHFYNDAEDSLEIDLETTEKAIRRKENKRQPDNNIRKEGNKPKRRKFERLEGWAEWTVDNIEEMRSHPEVWTISLLEM